MQAARENRASGDLRIVGQTSEHVMVVEGDLVIHRLRGAVTQAYLDHSAVGLKAATEQSADGKYVLVVLIEATAKIPESGVRAESTRLWKKTESALRGHVIVLEGDGFWAAAVRSVLAGIMIVGRSAVPREVVRKDDDAMKFLAKLEPSLPARYVRAIGKVRAIQLG